MPKNIWQQLVAVIIFIWALWNYEITLSLLGSALGILMPLITGCVIAFTVFGMEFFARRRGIRAGQNL